MSVRFGFGYDSHRFGASRPLRLGGVEVPHRTGLAGHSDGDAVAHALTDALLGAAALGDIGHFFPDTDLRWKDADSMAMLRRVRDHLVHEGFQIINVDATVVTEEPKLAPYIAVMRDCVSRTLAIPVSHVSIKAKTNEKMDAVGEGTGLQVFAVASVVDPAGRSAAG